MGDGPVFSAQGLSNLARMEQMLANAGRGDMNGTSTHNTDHGNGQRLISLFIIVLHRICLVLADNRVLQGNQLDQ